jgi:uncharacterized membrane protein YjgN (DUF898 family)
MDEPGRSEPHSSANPYAFPAENAGTVPPPHDESAGGTIRYPVEFSATAGEYFRIWIVNLALTVLTIGIYSAWAKVRKKRYFYGHTRIDGDSFDYRANPVAILKGRIIAVALFTAYSFGGKISPLLGALFALVLLFAMPWLIVRSLAFNAHNSAYRNIRFNFSGRYAEPLKLLIGGGLLVVVTLGLGYPYVKALWTRFAAENHGYGGTRAALGDVTRSFYGVYLKALLMLIGAALLLGVIAGLFGIMREPGAGRAAALVMFISGVYVLYLLVFAYVHAQITNRTWNAVSLGPVAFDSQLRGRDLALIYITNIIAVICTLGLAIPWAVVRTMRYRAGKTTLLAAAGLGEFVAAESAQVSATGEAVGEMFDFDFSL